MTVTIAERSLHVERREASLTRVSSVDAALQDLVDVLRAGPLHLDPARHDLVVAAARNLLNLVARTGSGQLDLLVDPERGTVVRVRHDGVAATAEVVPVRPAAPARSTAVDRGGYRPGTAAADPPAVGGPAAGDAGRPLRGDVREDIARRRRAARAAWEGRHQLVAG